jgi:toxin YoeB
MEIILTEKANLDLLFFKKANNQMVLKKIRQLFEAMLLNPSFGIGKPEKLKHDLSGKWSRRINGEHRLIYEIDENQNLIIVHSMKGHY